MPRKKILIIDDDLEIRQAMQTIIPNFGFEPHIATDPKTFIEVAKKENPDLYMIDLQLGQFGNGFNLITAVRSEIHSKAPILVLSESDDLQSISHALELGATDYVVKPFDKAFVAAILSQYLSSDQIESYRPEESSVSFGDSTATMVLDFEVTEVDELGIKLQSKHLIPKGTALKLTGPLITELCGGMTSTIATVSTTTLEPMTMLYQAYAEFNPTDYGLLKAVTEWLSRPGRLTKLS